MRLCESTRWLCESTSWLCESTWRLCESTSGLIHVGGGVKFCGKRLGRDLEGGDSLTDESKDFPRRLMGTPVYFVMASTGRDGFTWIKAKHQVK